MGVIHDEIVKESEEIFRSFGYYTRREVLLMRDKVTEGAVDIIAFDRYPYNPFFICEVKGSRNSENGNLHKQMGVYLKWFGVAEKYLFLARENDHVYVKTYFNGNFEGTLIEYLLGLHNL